MRFEIQFPSKQKAFATRRDWLKIYLLRRKFEMKLFQTIQNNFRVVGYIRNHNGHRFYAFNLLLLKANLAFIFGITSTFIFVIHPADNPREYMDAFYTLTVTLLIFVAHIYTTFGMTKFFDFFDHCEEVFESKLHIYCV